MLDPALEGGQGLVPELIEVLAQRLERVRVERVNAARAVGAIDDEPGVLEDAEVLRDRRPAHGKVARQLADRPGPVDEPREDPAPGGIAERVKLWVVVSLHLR